MKNVLPSMLLSLCSLLAMPAHAGQILIDFETLPGVDGMLGTADDTPMPDTYLQPLRDQFSAIGLTFTQGSLLQASFYDGNAANHFISSTSPIALLTKPVTGISIGSYSYWDAVLTAYDIDGNAIASSRLSNPQAGSTPLRGELSLTSNQLIYGFSVLPDNPNYILNLDNLLLTTSDTSADVPEPPSTALIALGLLLSTFSLRKRFGER
ncbi:PEP-CTERM sorting domain-containing protein [Massilia sp. TN1-12]|uniref:PEP-CTERM sorting domain-containing protein n=1 Tax=Massilia paldalensis TaxID=3377675 RepID=UPI00384D3BCF